ncbi:hypothetical protein [Spirosoma jeollabukense]
MKKGLISRKFTQTFPATTLYWHTCKFTGKRFVSPSRRVTYSAEGMKLKKEQDRLIKEAAKLICKVYFYLCPITDQWFTTRIAGSRFSPASKAITYQSTIDYAREHRKNPEVRERERIRSQARKDYRKQWHQRRAAAKGNV